MKRKNLPPHLPYDKSLVERARELRNNATPAEKLFWHYLKEMEFFQEFTFNRQKPIGHYIVDFYCHQLRLVIEMTEILTMRKRQKNTTGTGRHILNRTIWK